MIRRGSLLSNAWLVTGASLGSAAVLIFFLWSMGSRPSLRGKTLRLFCAAGMIKPVQAIVEEYQKTYGVTIQPDYRGTGELMVSMSKAGVAGDLFLSADSMTMDDAVKEGIVAEVIPIANIRPVLVVHRQTQEKLIQEGKPLAGLRDLLRDDFKIVLALEGVTKKVDGVNKTLGGAAIGRVGKAIFQRHGLWEELERRRQRSDALVSNQGTVMQVAQHVSSNSGFAGLVWDATAKDYPNLVSVPFPLDETEDVQQIRIGVLKRSANPATALHFARFLTARDKGLKAFAEHKFDVVSNGDYWAERPRVYIDAGAMLQPGLQPLLTAFEDREGVKVTPIFDGCGILVSAMQAMKRKENPRHFPDAFISCDVTFHKKVEPYFEAERVILQNDLVMIVKKGNPKNIKESLDELKRTDLRIGLPNPEHSAMGAMIVNVLQELNFPETAYDPQQNPNITNQPKADLLVQGVGVGPLDLAIVGRSNALSHRLNAEKRLEVLKLTVATATQTFAISRDSRHPYLMERLLRALTTPESLKRFRELGFKTQTGNQLDSAGTALNHEQSMSTSATDSELAA